MFGRGLVPVSLRESSSRLTAMLGFLRSLGCEEALLLHVVSGASGNRSRRRLEALCAEVDAGIPLDTKVVAGSPATEIVRCARTDGADFIAIPWTRKNWLQRTLVGSTTRDVVRLSDHPVFIYKNDRVEETAPTVLYATALGQGDELVLPLFESAGIRADRLILLHVGRRAPDPPAEQSRKAAVITSLDELARRCEAMVPDRTVDPRDVTGSPRQQIVRTARRENADLVVLAKSERTGELSDILGSTAEAVAYNARQSVLIVGGEPDHGR